MSVAIKVENLSKIYRLGEIGTGTISRDIERFVKTKILKQEDPFLKIGETNDRATKGASDIVYSLKDINFEIEQGDAVGIIGRNGAGKSTLLKILSRVTSPTTGKINIKGRVASLLEVGTGFHPELTGRENIYLNGAILGMRKREIDRKLEEIIDFSGVERYIDTPVKRYSSGMYVRLAFAVAANLESEILIVDEVLAVGDAEFQKKCLGKMGEVSKEEGRTVLFVSHNMAAVRRLCNKSIIIKNGILEKKSDTGEIIDYYTSSIDNYNSNSDYQYRYYSKDIFLKEISFIAQPQKFNSSLEIKTIWSNLNNIQFGIEIIIRDFSGTPIYFYGSGVINSFEFLSIGLVSELVIKVPSLPLAVGKYTIDIIACKSSIKYLSYIESALVFNVIESDPGNCGKIFVQKDSGCVYLDCFIETNLTKIKI